MENQITPFNITTTDGELLYAWHVLPIGVYAKHEAALVDQVSPPVEDVRETLNFKLLFQDPESRLVIFCT